MSKYIVVITGGRKNFDRAIVQKDLSTYDPATTILRHGGAPGYDSVAAHVAEDLGIEVEPAVRPDWNGPCAPDCDPGHRRKGSNGKTWCPSAAFRRNQKMLDMGCDELHAFPGANGTTDTVHRARAMGIKTTGWDPDV